MQIKAGLNLIILKQPYTQTKQNESIFNYLSKIMTDYQENYYNH